MLNLWNQEFSWNVYRNVWAGNPNWVVIGLLADWQAIMDDNGNLHPVDCVPTRRA